MTNTNGTRPSVWIITNMCRFCVFFLVWYLFIQDKKIRTGRQILSFREMVRKEEREREKKGRKGKGKASGQLSQKSNICREKKSPFCPFIRCNCHFPPAKLATCKRCCEKRR